MHLVSSVGHADAESGLPADRHGPGLCYDGGDSLCGGIPCAPEGQGQHEGG